MSEYAKLLRAPEWIAKRSYIVRRDQNTCTICDNRKLFELGSFVYTYHIAGLRDSLLITFKDFKSEKEGQVYMSKKYLDQISTFTPLIVSKRVNNLGTLDNFAVGFRKRLKKDWELVYLKRNTGKNHSDYIYAFNAYREETYNALEVIGGLEVHHTYYKVSLKPWEYPDDALTTLCWCCHGSLHMNGKVPVLDDNGNVIGDYTNCSRCNGIGLIPEFSHVQSGICFRCNGAKYEELI